MKKSTKMSTNETKAHDAQPSSDVAKALLEIAAAMDRQTEMLRKAFKYLGSRIPQRVGTEE